MRFHRALLVAIVAGCGGNGTSTRAPSSVPGASDGGGVAAGTAAGDGGVTTGPGATPGATPDGGAMTDGGATSTGGGVDGGGSDGGVIVAPPCSTTPQLLARQPFYTEGLAVDDATVFFAAHDSERTQHAGSPVRVWAVPIAGGTPRAIGGPDDDGGSTLVATNSTAVFFAQVGEVVRFAKDGSSRTSLAQADAFAIADARGYLYYTAVGGIFRVPEDGGGAPTNVVATTTIPSGLAFDATQVWFAVSETIYRAPADGGAAVAVTTVHDGWAIVDVAVDDHAVYFDTGNSGNIYAADKHDGSTRVVVHRDNWVSSLVADGGNLYWVGPGWYVGRAGKDGSNPTALVAHAGYVRSLVVRGDSLFYTQWDDGSVYRVCK